MSIRKLDESIVRAFRSEFIIESLSRCVEELLYNSLDARATAVTIHLNVNNLSCSVTDNGIGILPADMQRVAERYHTSKCHSIDEYNHRLTTYGWRGEALSSIGEVAELIIKSRPDSTHHSTRARKRSKRHGAPQHESAPTSAELSSTTTKHIKYGRLVSLVSEDPANCSDRTELLPTAGTFITVANLFSQIPVRQIRAKQEAARSITTIIQRISLICIVHPALTVTLVDDCSQQVLVSKPAVSSLQLSFSHVYHPDLAAQLLPIPHTSSLLPTTNHKRTSVTPASSTSPFTFTGIFSRLTTSFPSRDLQHLYVNGRPIVHKPIQKLIDALCKKAAKFVLGSTLLDTDDAEVATVNRSASARQLQASAGKIRNGVRSSGTKARGVSYCYYAINIQCSPTIYDIHFDPHKSTCRFVDEDQLLAHAEHMFRDWLYCHYPHTQQHDRYLFPSRSARYNNLQQLRYDAHSPTPYVRHSPSLPEGGNSNRMISDRTFVPLAEMTPPMPPKRSLAQAMVAVDEGTAARLSPMQTSAGGDHTRQLELTPPLTSPPVKMHCHCTLCAQSKIKGADDCTCCLCVAQTDTITADSLAPAQPMRIDNQRTVAAEIKYQQPPDGNKSRTRTADRIHSMLSNLLAHGEAQVNKSNKKAKRQLQQCDINTSVHPPPVDCSICSLSPQLPAAELPVTITRDMLRRGRMLGQFDQKFLLLDCDGVVLAVDQHAADERTNYERLMSTVHDHLQMVAVAPPQVLQWTAQEAQVVRTHIETLRRWCWSVDLTSECKHQILVTYAPQIFDTILTPADLREHISHLAATPTSTTTFSNERQFSPAVHRLIQSRACRMSMMFGTPLPFEAACHLMNELMMCEMPFNCAHGRPTMTTLYSIHHSQQPTELDSDDEATKLLHSSLAEVDTCKQRPVVIA